MLRELEKSQTRARELSCRLAVQFGSIAAFTGKPDFQALLNSRVLPFEIHVRLGSGANVVLITADTWSNQRSISIARSRGIDLDQWFAPRKKVKRIAGGEIHIGVSSTPMQTI